MFLIQDIKLNDTLQDPLVYNLSSGMDSTFLVVVHTSALFRIGGVLFQYPPGVFALFSPHTPIYFKPSDESLCFDWIQFSTNEAYVVNAGIPSGQPYSISNPAVFQRLFQLLELEGSSQSPLSTVIIEKLMQILFLKMNEITACKPTMPMVTSLQELRSNIYRQPAEKWTVSLMAAQINLSPGYLNKIYKATFGVSCMNDVIASRIIAAKNHLLNSSLSIAEIASICGYKNVEHFCRQFKKNVSVTPGQFRADLQNQNRASLWKPKDKPSL